MKRRTLASALCVCKQGVNLRSAHVLTGAYGTSMVTRYSHRIEETGIAEVRLRRTNRRSSREVVSESRILGIHHSIIQIHVEHNRNAKTEESTPSSLVTSALATP